MIKPILTILAGLFLVLILRQFRPEYAFLVRLCIMGTVLLALLAGAETLLKEIGSLNDEVRLDADYLLLMTKALGICFVTETAASICRDCSETALAVKVELIGKIAVVSLALPVLREIVKLCASFL